jgi:hypothetical protein
MYAITTAAMQITKLQQQHCKQLPYYNNSNVRNYAITTTQAMYAITTTKSMYAIKTKAMLCTSSELASGYESVTIFTSFFWK